MPMYEYACVSCDHAETVLAKIDAARQKKCPACGKARSFRRQLSAPAFHLKGTGWYVTDFKDGNNSKQKDKVKASGDNKQEKQSSDKPASKEEKPAKSGKDKQGQSSAKA